MRIRSHLLLLAAVVLVPGFLAAIVAVENVRQGEREAALRGLRETVRATALLVDGQVQRSLGALTALANSPSLQAGNFAALYEQATAIDQRPDVWTLLLDETGTQRLNTTVPFGSAPPPPVARPRVATVLASQRPLVTDVFVGPATGKLLTTIYVPVKPAPAGRFVVAQSFSVEHWKNTMLQPQGHSDWIVAVIDRQGKFISRSHLADKFVGQAARPELVAAATASHDGVIRHATLEGIDSYDAFTHSALTGWTIAVAAPVASIEASATQAVAWLSAGVAAALAAALLGASMLNRTLIRAMDSASTAARTLGEGRQPEPLHTSLDEVNVLGDALAGAGTLLLAERGARATLEAQRERLLENERSARAGAQRDNVAKDQFIALLGHELRTPLAAITGAAELLARGPEGDPKTRRMVGIIQRQNRHLKHIVDDLLEMSRMLSGKIALDARPLDLAESVRNCIEALRATDRALGRRLALRADEVWVRADPVRLEQIVSNLVTNALKFSEANSEVRVGVSRAGDQAVIEVADHGAGIAPELMPHIFEPFVQGPKLTGVQASGLGIGLALVKHLVELHGGEIRAHSNGSGMGSTFVVSLPRVAVSTTDVGGDAPQRPSACRVLLVEDDTDARETMAELLRERGYRVVEAEDGDAALRAVHACAPDVVVMDLGLPGTTGYQVATEMKATAGLEHVPLIALSGYGQHREADAARAACFAEHLVKPVPADALAQAIERHRARALDRQAEFNHTIVSSSPTLTLPPAGIVQ